MNNALLVSTENDLCLGEVRVKVLEIVIPKYHIHRREVKRDCSNEIEKLLSFKKDLARARKVGVVDCMVSEDSVSYLCYLEMDETDYGVEPGQPLEKVENILTYIYATFNSWNIFDFRVIHHM